MPGWLRTWLFIAVIAGGVVLLWVGLTVLLVVLLAALVPYWLWRLVARPREARGPVTIEGEVVSDAPVSLESTVALGEEERARLAATPVWVVWYEVRPHAVGGHGAFGAAVCFSEEDAKDFSARKHGHGPAPAYRRHEIRGPENPLTTTLFGAQRAEILRAILRRLEAGSREPIAVRTG